jgi:Mg-chelatase subunit ChlD
MAYLEVCRVVYRRYARRTALFVTLLGALAALLLLRPNVTDAATAGNNPPTNMSCQGWQRDTVIVSWKDNDNDEANYRVERSIDGAAFTEIATVAANGTSYSDTGIDVNKNYRYRVRGAHGDATFTSYGPICNNRRIFETSNVANNGFRIFYGLEGTSDDCPAIDGNDVCLANTNPLAVQQTALEGATDAFQRVGFDRDAAVPSGGLDKIPVNVIWCDGGGCAGGNSLGLSPFLLETPFDLTTRVGDPIPYLVSEHEAFHFQQFKYGGLNDPADKWVIEGQARSTQDKICLGANRGTALCFDDIATGYAGYVPELNGYLSNTNRPINQTDYQSALFWTYLTEKFGTSAVGDATEGGMNLMVEFWKESAANPGRDGIAVLNSTLATLGTSMRFRDIWKDFAVANYAKNLTGTGVQTKYQYADMAQPGGNYNNVSFAVSQTLTLNQNFLRTGETVYPWAARYYRFKPAADVPLLNIRVNQDSNTPVYYTVMGVRNNDVVYEYNTEARNLNQSVLNSGFTQVVVIVAGLDSLANYRVSVNGTQPSLQILSPTTANKARVGSIAAPEKFRVAVQLLASDGTPLSGVDLGSFNFRVGTKDVPDDQILTSAVIQDQEWFVLRAPTQDAAGQFDLHVDYASSTVLSATNTLAVDYTPRTSADNMLLIDDSGSMTGPKLDAAKKAAKLYVDSWRAGDKLGVIGFNTTPSLVMALKDWTDSGTNTRGEAFGVIDGLTAGGGTNIGDSLTMGFNQLTTSGDPSHDWALVLLSDGKEQDSSPTVDFPTAISNIAGAAGKRPVIHAIAIGPDADGPKMQNAANATGGTYQFVSAPSAVSAADVMSADASIGFATTASINNPDSPQVLSNPRLDLNARYNYIASDVLGHQLFYTSVGPMNDGNLSQDNVTIPVEGSAAEFLLSLSFDGFCQCDVTLTAPGLGVIAPAEVDPGFRHLVWRVATPPSGNWQLIIAYHFIGPKAASTDSPQQEEALPPYLVQSSVKSDVILDAAFPVPPDQRVSGVPMPIVATLTENTPIVGANVFGYVTDPTGSATFIVLYDDGLHGDGAASDGVYANTYYKTGISGTNSGAGSYTLDLFATGSTANAGNFVRQKILGFFIFSSGDDDADGLPNEYENTHGGNNTTLDPTGDPDGDGRSTIDEFNDGTDPLDPDSDDGGESDGSESNTGSDPHNPADDGVPPTWAVAYPGVSKVFVRYAPRPAYTLVEIHRSESFTGTYTFLDQVANTSGIYTDTTVTNNQEYCYYVIGITSAGDQSTHSTPTCATPKADPMAPDGGFLINDGASHTDSKNVQLTIFASDSVSPHLLEGALPLDDLMQPPSDSATSVTDMRISNRGDMSGASFVPYADSAPWTLAQSSGLATVYMQFRDEAGNISRIIPNSIFVDVPPGPDFPNEMLLPFLRRQQ